jgi:hypothetical protein
LGDACPCRQGRFFGGWTAKGHVLCQKEMTAFLEFVKGHLDSRDRKPDRVLFSTDNWAISNALRIRSEAGGKRSLP